MSGLPAPAPSNAFLADHVSLLCRNFLRLTGRNLIAADLAPSVAAERLFHAPFVVLSHNAEPDPVFTYGNLSALSLFELDWEALTSMPSRHTAEAPDRAERDRLLTAVSEKGFIDNYSGVRISRTGRRFLITRATVWNLYDGPGGFCGQAATFPRWEWL
jgi:hypothetical protein